MHLTALLPLPLSLLLVLPFIPAATAWGGLGHRTVAYLASMYFTTESNHFTNTLLNNQDISTAALFADKVRHMPQFAYSANWHFIDAHDHPPQQCGINMTRDCIAADGGCVVSAIANQTSRVADQTLSRVDRGQSLRFMLHFFGDIHQPLHTEAEGRGGNDIFVTFDGKRVNLHSLWDALIPNKHAGADAGVDEIDAAWNWASRLFQELGHGGLEAECLDDAVDCALEWAGEANAHVCDYVMKDGFRSGDLNGTYYDGAVPIIDELIGKAGRRLAAWVNHITDVTLQVQ